MPTKAKNTIYDTTATLPAYLTPPVREFRGLQLAIYKLGWNFRRAIGCKNYFSFNKRLFLKRGGRVHLTEALTMDFIARNTTIQVPRVIDVFSVGGYVHIVQEHIDGPVLEDVWHSLSLDQQLSSMMQLKNCLKQLRALKPPHPECVQAIDGSGFSEASEENGKYGPFEDHATFHQHLGHDIFRKFPERYPLLQQPLAKVSGRKYKTVFAHGDLGPHNILWKDGQIVIIDWERSGWFPEYWDYTRVYAARGCLMPKWWEMFRDIVDRYDDEVDVDVNIANYVETL